jgi:hypothetical protein
MKKIMVAAVAALEYLLVNFNDFIILKLDGVPYFNMPDTREKAKELKRYIQRENKK